MPTDTSFTLRSQDIQTGLQSFSIRQFENLPIAGWTARISIHLRGIPKVSFDVMKELSHILFGVPKQIFGIVIQTLQEIGYVQIINNKNNEKQIIPHIPYFDELYYGIDDYISSNTPLNQFEETSIHLLNLTAEAPISKQKIISDLDITENQYKSIIEVGTAGSYLEKFKSRYGDELLVSPLYFSENPSELASIVGKIGTDTSKRVLSLIRDYPGWPLEVIRNTKAIDGNLLNKQEMDFIEALIAKKVLQPPIVATQSSKQAFLFTPKVGNQQIEIIEKAIYEKTLAIISCIRHGQHFAAYPIKYPKAIINSLKRDGWLRATKSAKEQYRTLSVMKICTLKNNGNGWYEPHLIRTQENIKAIDVALEILTDGDIKSDRGMDKVAGDVLKGNLTYNEFIRSYSQITLKQHIGTKETELELDKLLEELTKG